MKCCFVQWTCANLFSAVVVCIKLQVCLQEFSFSKSPTPSKIKWLTPKKELFWIGLFNLALWLVKKKKSAPLVCHLFLNQSDAKAKSIFPRQFSRPFTCIWFKSTFVLLSVLSHQIGKHSQKATVISPKNVPPWKLDETALLGFPGQRKIHWLEQAQQQQ